MNSRSSGNIYHQNISTSSCAENVVTSIVFFPFKSNPVLSCSVMSLETKIYAGLTPTFYLYFYDSKSSVGQNTNRATLETIILYDGNYFVYAFGGASPVNDDADC